MEIVEYKTTDSKQVAKLFREIFKESGWEERPSDHMDEPHVLFHLPNDGLLLLAKDKGEVVATGGVIFLNKTEGLVKRFYLKKSYRGSGLAQQFLNELIAKAKSRGLKKLMLDVSLSNTRAIHFYEKSGFLSTQVSPQDFWPESKEPQTHKYFYKDIDLVLD